MQRILSTLTLLLVFALLPVSQAQAWLFDDDPLVTIDGDEYMPEDFKRWWGFWNEEGMTLPESPDFYVEWLLFAREGRRMDLDSAPGFKRGTRVFLQSRTLLKLKYEEVDSQIKVTEQDIKTRYEEEFLPRYLLEGMEFADEATFEKVYQDLQAGVVTVAEVLARDTEANGPVKTAETTLRASTLEKKWQDVYKEFAVGDIIDPEKLGKRRVLWYLKEIKSGDKEDLAALRESISKDIWKEREIDLTLKLVERLRVKYEVKVDEERLVAIDLQADKATLSDAPVITSSQRNFSEKEFAAVMQRLFQSRPMMTAGALADEQALKQLMKDTAYNVITQSVTNWESLDRRYEEKEPFKWEYEFNYNHRLTLDVQQRLFAPQAKVTDEDAKQHYLQYKKRYSIPPQVKIFIVDETQGSLERVWADVATGMSFDKAVKKHLQKSPGLQEVPFNHLDPELKPVVAKLVDGETSQIVNAQGVKVLVHLVKSVPERAIPFARVKESIIRDLYLKKIDQLKLDYLTKIKSGSQISVQQEEWKDIQKELGGA